MRRIWTTKRLFVSSTFVDMIPERDLIAKRVLPRLSSRGEARATHVIGVDLRWGIAVDSDAERRLVARQCLEAVDACRPYLLAMVGPSRGWVPTIDDFETDFLDQHPALRRALELELSLTELEIAHALAPLAGSPAQCSALILVQGTTTHFSRSLSVALARAGRRARRRTAGEHPRPCIRQAK